MTQRITCTDGGTYYAEGSAEFIGIDDSYGWMGAAIDDQPAYSVTFVSNQKLPITRA